MNETPVVRRLVAIVAADVVGYSRLMEAHEERTLAALKQHRREFIDPAIDRHGGRIFKVMGDGMLVEFGSVLNAARCAIEIQRGMVDRNAGIPEDRHIRFRIGMNVGDLIVDGDDYYGDGVNVAARLEGLAPPGGISCSAVVRTQLGNRIDVDLIDQGEKVLKNIEQPVRVFFFDLAPPASSEKGPAASRSDKPSVAVLPFTNMSNDPEQEFFSDGITEDIITDLSNVSGLFVLGRNTVFAYKGRSINLTQVARELGVSFLLEGSVRKAGQKVRINAQLIEGATGGHVWAARYDRDLTDIFEVQDEITQTIVAQLKVKLLPGEREAISHAPTGSIEAYTYYLKGRDFFRRATKPNLLVARQMFARAIELDPLYARAYAGLADCDSFLFLQYSEGVSIDGILSNCAKALSIDPRLAEARASRGLALSLKQQFAEAEAELALAMEGNPDLFEAHYFYARLCFSQGKLEEAARHFERAAEVNVDDYQSPALVQQVYTSLGMPEKALAASRRAVERAARDIERNPGNPRPLYLGANALAVLGRIEEADAWAERALALDPDDILTKYNIACHRCFVGDIDAAFELLIDLLPHANHETKAWVLQDTDFAPLRSDPRWSRVVDLAGGLPTQ
jgi:adenylate cyclase